jgi:hypothetical protein
LDFYSDSINDGVCATVSHKWDLEFGGFYQDLLRDEDDECCLILESYDDDVGAGD